MLSIGGVCCILQPWNSDFQPTLHIALLGYGLSAIYGIFLLFDMLILFHFNFLHEQENQNTVIFWMLVIGTVLSFCVSAATEKLVIPSTVTDWLLVFGHCGTYGVILSTNMYVCSRLPGVVISLIGGTSVIYMCLAQYTFLSHIQSGNQNALELCGVGVVLLSSIFPPVYAYFQERKSCS